jgi:outer membrane protease
MNCLRSLERWGLRKTTKNLSHDIRCPGRYSNQAPPEHTLRTHQPVRWQISLDQNSGTINSAENARTSARYFYRASVGQQSWRANLLCTVKCFLLVDAARGHTDFSTRRTASVITSLWDWTVCFTPSQPLWGVMYSHVATELNTATEQIANTRNELLTDVPMKITVF